MAGQFRGTAFAGGTAAGLLLLASPVPSALRAAIPSGERQVLINLCSVANGGGWA